MKIFKLIGLSVLVMAIAIFSFNPLSVAALEPGTILYRTSGQGKMYGYSSRELIKENYGVITNVYSGHAGIYIGQEDGVDYVVEALGTGVVKTPAKYFVNEANGEKLVAAKLPKQASAWQRARAVVLAKYLASADLAYDFDFSTQKGPWSGDWTCVGLTEKIYESANANNPERLGALEYDPRYYAVDITPDGYDGYSFYNKEGDCFSENKEFSKIARRQSTILPAPEIIGYNAGKEYGDSRYIFIPYTQAVQKSLQDVPVDIEISSVFPETAVRGKVNSIGLVLQWSLINNPISSLKKLAGGVKDLFTKQSDEDALVWSDGEGSNLNNNTAVNIDNKKIAGSSLKAEINPSLNKVATPSDKLVQTNVSEKKSEDLKPVVLAKENNKAVVNAALSEDIFSGARPVVAVAEVATSSSKIVVNKPVAVSVVKKTESSSSKAVKSNVALWSPIAAKVASSSQPVATSTPVASTTPINTETDNEVEEDLPITLLISRIYTAGEDDWLEIWNYGEEDIDLAAQKIRLEKSRTAVDPGIILRFEADSDASFPGGKIIRAGEGYRVVRDEAAADLRGAAQALAWRADFTLADDGYTLYLAKGAVSSPTDADIIDFVGYGAAKYFQGEAPAPALQDGYLLRRKADANTQLEEILTGGEKANWPLKYNSGHNDQDWLLWPLGGILPVVEEEDEEENDSENNDNEEDNENSNSTSTPVFSFLPGVNSAGLYRLWSFEECRGNTSAEMISGDVDAAFAAHHVWDIGRFGCGQLLSSQLPPLITSLNPQLSGENFTLSFKFKGADEYAHPHLILENGLEGVYLRLDIFDRMVAFEGFPGLSGRYNGPKLMDNTWHTCTLVWDALTGYWSLYFDDQRAFHQEFSGLVPGFDVITFGTVGGHTIIDELALWNRALPTEEIKYLALSNQPFNPQPAWIEPAALNLIHAWNFDEASGSIAHDNIGGLDWSLPNSTIVFNGVSGKALTNPLSDSPYQLNIPGLKTNNFSASWWWQNNAGLPYSGRLHLSFNEGNNALAVFSLDNWRQRLSGKQGEDIWSEGYQVIPDDALWHHLALVYDDYRYLWQLFVDGVLKLESQQIPLIPGSNINNLSFSSTAHGYKMDNFKLWEGALDATKVLSEYQAEKPD